MDGLFVQKLPRLKINIENRSKFKVIFGRECLVEMFVFGEEVIEDAKGWLQVKVDDVLGSGLRPGQSGVLHQFESQSDVSHFLREWLKQLTKEKNEWIYFFR